jgi:curved DNA-binding protein CbpA
MSSGQPPDHDLYADWGIPRDTDAQALRTEIKKLKFELHPDRRNRDDPVRDAEDEELFKDLSANAEWLTKPALRRIYDAHLDALEYEAECRRKAAEAAEDPERTQRIRDAFSNSSSSGHSRRPPRTPPSPPPPSPPPSPAEALSPRPAGPRIGTLVTLGIAAAFLFVVYRGCDALINAGKNPSGQGSTSADQSGRSGSALVGVSHETYGQWRIRIEHLQRSANTFSIRFVADGGTNNGYLRFRPPEKSCVEVAGDQKIPALRVKFSKKGEARYSGTMIFGYGDAGMYRFRYACNRSYSPVPLFERRAAASPQQIIGGVVGVSRESASFYTRVGPVYLYPGFFVVKYMNFGGIDYSRFSCVAVGDKTLQPKEIEITRKEGGVSPYRGGYMTFPYAGSGSYQFMFGCESSPVALFDY